MGAPEIIVRYFKAKEDGILASYYLDKFRFKRDNYLDELPSEDVRNLATLDERGCFVGDNYKCRGNYIVGLGAVTGAAINDSVISDLCLIETLKQFRLHDFGYHHGEFTTIEEIEMINQILNGVIQYLERKCYKLLSDRTL